MAIRCVPRTGRHGVGCIDLQPRQLRFAVHGANRDFPNLSEIKAAMGTVISKSVAVPTALGGVISWLPHYASGQLIPLTIAFPALTMLQSSRGGAAGVALAYYGVASFPVAQVSSGYFGHASPAVGV